MHNEPKSQDEPIDNTDAEDATDDNASFEAEQTIVMSETDFPDPAGTVAGDVDVDQLMEDAAAETDCDIARKQKVRRKLEEIAEEQGFEETYAIEFEKD